MPRTRNRRVWCLVAANVLWAGALLVLLSQAPLAAQQPSPDSTPAAATDGTRSPFTAGALQWVSGPLLLGYVYAGDVKRGLLPGAIMIGGVALVVVNLEGTIDSGAAEADPALFLAGLIVALAASTYSIFDAADAARDHNARLAVSSTALRLMPTGSGLEVAIALPLP